MIVTKTRMWVALSIALLCGLLAGRNVNAAGEGKVTTSEKGVVATLRGLPEASRFMENAEKSGVLTKLEGKGPVTILVPTNKAFEAAKDRWQKVRGNSEKEKLFCIYHVLQGSLTPEELKKAESQATVCEPDKMKMNCAKIFHDNKNMIQQQIKCPDGRIYLINELLIPPCCEEKEEGRVEKLERNIDRAMTSAARSAEELSEAVFGGERTSKTMKSNGTDNGKANGNSNGKTNGNGSSNGNGNNGNGSKTPATSGVTSSTTAPATAPVSTPATRPLPDNTVPQ